MDRFKKGYRESQVKIMKYYPEGIDKIKVILNPLLLNKENMQKYFDPYQRLTLHQAGAFTALSIHDEWFNPFFDYQIQIAMAIHELIKKKVINFPDNIFTLYTIYTNPSFFFVSIVCAEFYFDYKKENIWGYEEMSTTDIIKAKEEGLLYRYTYIKDDGSTEITKTFYTNDKTDFKKSIFSLYDRLSKLLHDNNKDTAENIKNFQNEIRCEIRLFSNNSPYLQWENFKGNYTNIINRFIPYLSVIYNNHICGLFNVKGKENKEFNKIISLSQKQQSKRYRGNKLHEVKTASENIKNSIKEQDILEKLDKTSINFAKRTKAKKINELALKIGENS
jgi:hypothetical protein